MESERAKFEDLCLELNMDRDTQEMSWKKLNEVSQRSTLEGNKEHWFCCALYAACRGSYIPTVGGTNAVVMGNGVSLKKLLRCCNMSIYEFISKIKVWHELAPLSSGFYEQIERLERTCGITSHLFPRFNEIFEKIFQIPPNEKKNTKYRSAAKCSSNKLYDMAWCLYLCAKNENPNRNVDIVTSYHLLICCFDLIYKNVLAENRVDLININFEGVPKNWNTPEFDPTSVSTHCIIEPLCQIADALCKDAKVMKENYFKGIIKKFFQSKTLYGSEETFLGIVSNSNFEQNVKSLNSGYEQYILSVGEFDERIFLSNRYCRKLGTETGESGRIEHHQEIQSWVQQTPYTRKYSLPTKESSSEPVATATNSVKKLQEISHISEPSDFIRRADEGTLQKIICKIQRMSEEFHTAFPNRDDATSRFKLAQSLFFYLLDRIIRDELRIKPNADFKVLLNSEMFIQMLIACCVEIVLSAYNSQTKFPWTLICFSISAFHFVKIIEMVVRNHENILTRELIKHLNYIEETCLESLAWQRTSPLWTIIAASSSPLPTWSEVDVDNMARRNAPQVQSPINSACDTFSSTTVSDTARRDLFNTARDVSVIERVVESSRRQPDITRRAVPLAIFCRKFYKLAWTRMKKLSRDLDMDNELYLNKIWTLFEISITKETELMKDRHLDQILMCAIYLYIKVGEIEGKSFTDIMKFYRKQPQASSSIYRAVLFKEGEVGAMPEYRDIIQFYNYNYVEKMKDPALELSARQESKQNVPLSPHPPEKRVLPRKLSNNHHLYITCVDKLEPTHSPNQMTYEFSKSPRKDLEKFNNIIKSRGKRNLPFTDDEIGDKKRPKYIDTTIRGIIKDRGTGQTTEDQH